MEVILLEKIHRLGELGDKVSVKPGFGRNYLIPQNKAVPATADNLKAFEEKRAELERAVAEATAEANERAGKLTDQTVTIEVRAGSGGKLFGSVGPADVAEGLVSMGIAVEKREIQMPDGPIREIGEYELAIQLHADVTTMVKVIVAPDAESVVDAVPEPAPEQATADDAEEMPGADDQ